MSEEQILDLYESRDSEGLTNSEIKSLIRKEITSKTKDEITNYIFTILKRISPVIDNPEIFIVNDMELE